MANRVPASSGLLECIQTSWTGWRRTSRQTHASPGPIWPLSTSAHATRFDASCQIGKCKTVHHKKNLAFAQIMYARLLSGEGKTRVRQKVQNLRLDKIVFSDEKMFRFGESKAQRTELQSAYESPRKRDLKPSMVALEGDKFMKRHHSCCWCHIGRWGLGAAFRAFQCENGIA